MIAPAAPRVAAEIEAVERELRDIEEAFADACNPSQMLRLWHCREARLHRLRELQEGRAL